MCSNYTLYEITNTWLYRRQTRVYSLVSAYYQCIYNTKNILFIYRVVVAIYYNCFPHFIHEYIVWIKFSKITKFSSRVAYGFARVPTIYGKDRLLIAVLTVFHAFNIENGFHGMIMLRLHLIVKNIDLLSNTEFQCQESLK